jgi:deferrochelatase/peroxidase EfeB
MHERARRRSARARSDAVPLPAGVFTALALSSPGIKAFGGDPGIVPDPHFVQGMVNDAESFGDEMQDGVPVGWKFGDRPETTPDLLFVFGSGDETRVTDEADRVAALLSPGAHEIHRDKGFRLEQDGEHFGFADGISQPPFRGRDAHGVLLAERTYPAGHPLAQAFSRPGQRLTWPGQFFYGYPSLELDFGPSAQPAGGTEPFLRNGSLLVVRRLRQDVAAFRDAMETLAQKLTDATGVPWSPERAGSRCVGRWQGGFPVSAYPDDHSGGEEGSELQIIRNGFRYGEAIDPVELTVGGVLTHFPGARDDRAAQKCPMFAHLRKVNLRDQSTNLGPEAVTLGMQMLRRGIPFGPRWPGHEDKKERGLLFMSYQTSITRQFHRLMTDWVQNATAPKTGTAIDPIIGVPKPGQVRKLTFDLGDAIITVPLPGRWVHTTGGGYFFAPGVKTLRDLFVR